MSTDSEITRSKAAFVLLALGIIAAFSWSAYSFFGGSQEEELAPALAYSVVVQKLEKADSYQVKREFIGRVESPRRTELAFELNGRVEKIYVDEGDTVESDELLAQQERSALVAELLEATAQVERAAIERDVAKKTYARYQAAAEASAVSPQRLDEARQDADAKAASFKVAKAVLGRVRVSLNKTALVAPYRGVVVQRSSDEGALAGSGTPILTLQEDRLAELRVGLPGDLAETVQIGAPLKVRINDQPADATVKAVLPVRNDVTRTVDLIMQSAVPAQPGDLVSLEWKLEKQTSGFWVPLSALTASIRGLWALYTPVELADGAASGATHKIEARLVEVIHHDGERVYVAGNLRHGDQIISVGVHRVVPGQQVRLVFDDSKE